MLLNFINQLHAKIVIASWTDGKINITLMAERTEGGTRMDRCERPQRQQAKKGLNLSCWKLKGIYRRAHYSWVMTSKIGWGGEQECGGGGWGKVWGGGKGLSPEVNARIGNVNRPNKTISPLDLFYHITKADVSIVKCAWYFTDRIQGSLAATA